MLWHCLACGGGNPKGTKFCGHCGNPAEATSDTTTGERNGETRPPAEDERRLVTALFADVSGFTILGDRLDLDELHDIIEPLISRLAAVGEGYGGTVAKYAGDALLIFFGAPISHEDHAERALMAALDMHRELTRLIPELGSDAANLQMHIGVNTGHAIAGMFGGQIRSDYSILGDAVNVAQRLEAAAPPGETFVGARTVELAAHRFMFESEGELELKGKSQPVPAWRLADRRTDDSGPHDAARGLVGREREMGEITTTLHLAADRNRPALVTLDGEPGVGKSRLVGAVHEWAVAHGWRWLEARCPSYGTGLPYWPYTQLLRAAFGATPGSTPTHPLDAFFARLLGLPPAGASHHETLEPEAFRRGLHDAFATWLAGLAEQQPVIVAIEDAHWADASSMALTADLVRKIIDAPVAVLLASRPEGRATLGAVRAAARGHAAALEVGPLDRAGVQALIEAHLGGDAPDRLVDAVTERSRGNPLFVGETVHALTDSGALVERNGRLALRPGWDPGEVPATVEGVLAARLDLLPPETAAVLQMASVVGRLVLLPLLRRLADSVTDLDDQLGELVDRGLLDPVPGESEQLLFHHALVTDVAYNRLLRRRRRELHLAVAQHAEALYGSGDEVIDLMARHLYLGEAGARAVDALIRAGVRARRLFANEEAILHLRRAAEITRRELTVVERLPMVLLDLADLYDLTGDYDAALQHYEEVRDGTGDVRAWKGMAAMLLKRGDREDALAVLDEAFAAPHPNGESAAPLWLERAYAMVLEDRYDEAVEAATAGIDVAAPDDPVIGELLLQLSQAELGLGRHDEALMHGQEAEARFTAAGDARGLAVTARILGRIHAEREEFVIAAAMLRRGLELVERVGSNEELAGCLVNLGMVEMNLGNLGEAVACDRRAVDELDRIGHTSGRATAYVNLSEKLHVLGDDDLAMDWCHRGLELAHAVSNVWVVADAHEILARVHLRRNRYAEAAAAAEEAAVVYEQLGRPTDATRALALAAEAHAESETLAEA